MLHELHNFYKQIPAKYQNTYNSHCSSGRNRGRPKDVTLDDAYHKVCLLLRQKEENDEQVTVSELTRYMQELVPEGYSGKYMRKKILEDYKDQVIISNLNGKPDVITFTSTAAKILQDFNEKKKKVDQDLDKEKLEIVKAAAEIIRNDIKALEGNIDIYPSSSDIQNINQLIPNTLLCFLDKMITFKDSYTIRCSIAQALIQNVRPRTIMLPIQLAQFTSPFWFKMADRYIA